VKFYRFRFFQGLPKARTTVKIINPEQNGRGFPVPAPTGRELRK
jgi:hypothetical protein